MQDRKKLKQALAAGAEQAATEQKPATGFEQPGGEEGSRCGWGLRKGGRRGASPAIPVRELFEHQMVLGEWLSFCRNPGPRVVERKIHAPFRQPCFGFVIWLGLAFWGVGFNLSSAAPATNSSSRYDYSAFKLINERNIFNTRRSPRYVPSDRRETRRTRSESFALVGTMRYEKGLFAFFDGTRSDYRKVLKQDDTIAGFKITAIEPSHVVLASATNEVDLRVGKQLRREDEGEWKMSDRPEVIEASPAVVSARPAMEPGASRGIDATNQQGFPNEAILSDGAVGLSVPFVGEEPAPDTVGTNAQAVTVTGGNDSESVLERLRRRREQENP